MSLTDRAIRNSRPRDKAFKLTDGAGLYLEVMPTGARYWRMRYRIAGKDTRLAFGVYPEVTLAEARERRDDARRQLRDGRDPSAERRIERRQAKLSAGNTFEGIAREWLAAQRRKLAPATYDKALRTLEANVFPWLGARPMAAIDAPEVLAIVKRIEARGAHETAHRVKARMSQVFRYAIAHGNATRDPSADLRGALAPVVSKSHAAITDPAKVGDLLRALDDYSGQFVTRCALRLAPLLFARPGELRHAEWSEFDTNAAEWRIPAHKMKMREAHVVPLSSQAVAILHELQPLTGRGRYLFPGVRTPNEPMSNNTVNAALRRLGFDKDTMTGHGFRALASTRLNEMGWAPDVIERQLAHAERNKVRAAYNRAQYMAERRKMMQAWANYLEQLRADTGQVVGSGVRQVDRITAPSPTGQPLCGVGAVSFRERGCAMKNVKPDWFPLPLHVNPPMTYQHWMGAMVMRMGIANAPQSNAWKADRFIEVAKSIDIDWPAPNPYDFLGIREINPYQAFWLAAFHDHEGNAEAKALAESVRAGCYDVSEETQEIKRRDAQPRDDGGRYHDEFSYRIPVFLDLALDDETLKSHIDFWLKLMRGIAKESGADFFSLGVVTPDTFKRWHQYRVLAAYDLITWRKISGAKYSDAAIAAWLWPDDGLLADEGFVDRAERFRKVTKPLVNAVMDWYTVDRLEKLWAGELMAAKIDAEMRNKKAEN